VTAGRQAELLAAAAANSAAWHTSCLAALHVGSDQDEGAWSTDGAAPFIFLSAITLGGPERGADHASLATELATKRPGGMGINDTWSSLALARLGFERHDESWFVREPGLAAPVAIDGRVKRVSSVDELREYETMHHAGFETPVLHDYGPLGVYGPAILDDPAMHILVVRDEAGTMVSGAMGYVAGGVVGIYSVATPPEHRRRGYGAAVTAATLNVAPELPAVLQPSAMGEAIYRRLGFVPLAPIVNWIRRP
jgi:GNAT superfamily N-acetyltransferase